MLFLDDESILEKSINSGINMKFNDFIKFNKIDLNEIYVDKLFHNLQNKLPIYMNEEMIEYLGYAGSLDKQKEKLNNILSSKNFSKYKGQLYFKYNANEYIVFRAEKSESLFPPAGGNKICDTLYPNPIIARGVINTIHLLIMPRLFKEILMLCNTDKGKQVRSFYLNMVDVFELYTKYQNKLIVTTLEQKLDKMSLTMVESNQKAEDERKRSEERFQDERKQAEKERKQSEERFNTLMNRTGLIHDTLINTESKLDIANVTLINTESKLDIANVTLANTESKLDRILPQRVELHKLDSFDIPCVIILQDMDAKFDEYNLYVLRIQSGSIKSAIKKFKNKNESINVITVYRSQQPNAVAFWKIVRANEDLIHEINKCPKENWFGLNNMTTDEFINILNEIEETRKQALTLL